MSASTTRRSGSRPSSRAPSRSSGTASAPGPSAATTTHWWWSRACRAGTTTPYDVRLDGEVVWPPAGSKLPRPRIRTLDPTTPLRVVFGSCRYATPGRRSPTTSTSTPTRWTPTRSGWPGCPTTGGRTRCCCSATRSTPTRPRTRIRAKIRDRRDISVGAVRAGRGLRGVHLALPRGLERPGRPLAAVDDPVVDDLRRPRRRATTGTPRALWRREMQQTSWWEERDHRRPVVVLGLPAPRQPLAGRTWPTTRALPAGPVVTASDCEPMLREFAAAADKEADGRKGAQWSYRRDLGDVRLLVIDSRCGRMLDDRATGRWCPTPSSAGSRSRSTGPTTTCWSAPRCRGCSPARCTTSSPGTRCWPTAPAARGWSRAGRRSCGGPPTSSTGRRSGESFDRLAELFRCVGRGEHAGSAGSRPARSACCPATCTTRTRRGRSTATDVRSPVYQLTCSPVHNYVPRR